MTLTELRYIVAVSKSLHFGQAAKACHVTQPTLSMAIHKLEDELNVKLFERKHNDIQVTQVGQQIIEQAQRVLAEADTVKTIAQKSRDELTSPLKIGAIFTVGPYLFPALIPQIRRIAPHMPLIVEEDYTHHLRQKLHGGELDVIFIALPFEAPSVVTKKLYDEELVVLLPKKHPLSAKSAISPKDLKNEELILLGEGHCFRDAVMQVCPHCVESSMSSQAVQGSSLETIRHMVASDMGITILPSTATEIRYYNRILTTKPFTSPTPKREIAMVWRDSFPLGDVVNALLKAVHACKLTGVSLQ